MGLQAARTGGVRDLALSLAVLLAVAALALALRRSITRPLGEVSAGARTLSSGDLTFDVRYAGRDEIGDVAAAFRDLHVTAERLAGEIRATNAAISDGRWTTGPTSRRSTGRGPAAGRPERHHGRLRQVHGRRRRAERELEGIFNLSLDLLCITGTDGYFKRVNPSFERTSATPARSCWPGRPPPSCTRTTGPPPRPSWLPGRGQEVAHFENRYLRNDGAERWLQWSARSCRRRA